MHYSKPAHFVRLASAICCLALAGCAQNRFGVSEYDITLDSKPQGKPAYLVPDPRYTADTTIASDKDRLAKYYKGKTPVVVHIKPYVWDYIVQNPDGTLSPPLDFNPKDYPTGVVTPKE